MAACSTKCRPQISPIRLLIVIMTMAFAGMVAPVLRAPREARLAPSYKGNTYSALLPIPTASACNSTSFVSLTPEISVSTVLNFTTAHGLSLEIRTPPLTLCAPAVLTFVPLDYEILQTLTHGSASWDADELMALLGMTAWLHVYTSSSLSGEPCNSLVSKCTSFIRPLPLSLDVSTGTVVASFVPDPSAMHYVFSFSVR